MKQAFVLKDRDDPFLVRLQLWFNTFEFCVLGLPVDHPPLK